MSAQLRVLIAGAGLGGLTLARSLRGHGIDVAVFERDASPWDRPQGYRLHLDADAINAAREVLPDDLRAVFEATAQYTEPFTTILAPDLSVIKRLPTHDEHGDVWPGHDGTAVHANVDRATLRQILLAGLDDAVHFGRTLERYESTAEGVTAFFADGSTAHGDVLVGADGIRSAVRRQRAPYCETVDAGITAIYGRLPMATAEPLVPAETLKDIFTVATDERKVFLGLGSVRFATSPTEAAERHAPGIPMRHQDDYVVCIVGGRHEFFAGGDSDTVSDTDPAPASAPDPASASDTGRTARARSGEELREIAARTLQDWPAGAAGLVRRADPASFFLVEMRTSVPAALDTPVNVTLLGDAIHAMTPTLGRGANIAMRDGVLLGRELAKAADGRTSLAEALTAYEREMTAYGFSVVREAARTGEQRMAQNPLPEQR
ncbi:FAD-dependent oxidoreductase [Streptantibioticus silvisoli]|uniref:NAD(P)/FAD-dependent oxidoreductase n=1 Tax=Streptantibioticus silvisoli TaxID=2705255 RepID=A0ABT6VZA2_9ACTN|nr:NAD(P)/FAD-dependent oxidoreductase [Streptantibioticus silvisoli]MDI5963759.1 NAD(P)/FAD-dependent oxidoreductase [Streptantibioticus silvisoli]